MRGARLLAVLAVAAAALAAGCEPAVPKEAEGRQVVRPHLRFAIDVPQGWTFRDLYGDVVVEMVPRGTEAAGAKGPARRTQPVVDVVAVDSSGRTLDQWADEAVKESQELQSDLEVTLRETVRMADGRPALRVTLKNPRGIQPFIQQMLLVMTDRRAYGVLATAPESDLAAAEAAVGTCFGSLVVW
jgi:hypothetical protein